MPSDTRGGRGRSGIYRWRVKLGKKAVFSAPKKSDCATWARKNAHLGTLRRVAPNLAHT
jgi:hypothetical protein